MVANPIKVISVKQAEVSIEDLWNTASGHQLDLHLDEDGSIHGSTLCVDDGVYVDSMDTETGYRCAKRVTEIHRQLKPLWRIEYSGSYLLCSPEHKHWALRGGVAAWLATSDLATGDMLFGAEQDWVPITKIDRFDNPSPCYDLTVDDTHAYYANGVLTHNSHTVLHLAKSQAALGYKTVVVPLEMSAREQMARFLASAAGIDSLRINLKRLAEEEKLAAYKRFRRVDKLIRDANGRFTIFRPDEDMDIESTLAACHAFNPDVIYIDYIGLLKGADGDDQWRKLGQISRYGKVYAGNHDKIVAMAAQVGDDGRIRYAQAIKEHSSLAFIFVATKETKASGFLNVSMLKGRNQQNMDFTLKIEYEYSRVRDLEPNESADASNPTPPPDSKAKGTRVKEDSNDSFVPDLSE